MSDHNHHDRTCQEYPQRLHTGLPSRLEQQCYCCQGRKRKRPRDVQLQVGGFELLETNAEEFGRHFETRPSVGLQVRHLEVSIDCYR